MPEDRDIMKGGRKYAKQDNHPKILELGFFKMLFRGQIMQHLILGEDDIYLFLNNGVIKELSLGMYKYQIIKLFGMPNNYEPQRKFKKEIMGYGGLNIYLLDGLVKYFSMSALNNETSNINFEGISKGCILRYADAHNLSIKKLFEFDDIEYFQMDNRKLGFLEDALIYISAGM